MRCAVLRAARRTALMGGVLLGFATPSGFAQVLLFDTEYPWEPPPRVESARVLSKLSTLGQGFEYRYSYSPSIGLRAESFEHQERRERVHELLRTELQLNLRSKSLLFDWFPFDGRFRATVGIYANRSELRGAASFEDFYFEGVDISAEQINRRAREAARRLQQAGYDEYAQALDEFAAANTRSITVEGRTLELRDAAAVYAHVRVPAFAPYFGFGWANTDGKDMGLFYTVDIGVLDVGQARLEYSLGGSLMDAMRHYYGAELNAWIAEEEREAEERLRRYRYFPVVSLGVGYRF